MFDNNMVVLSGHSVALELLSNNVFEDLLPLSLSAVRQQPFSVKLLTSWAFSQLVFNVN